MSTFTCAAVAALGVLSAPRLGVVNLSSWPVAVSTFLLLFSVCWLSVTAYNVLIYPHYVSPYRHLPGPKVRPE